MRFFRNVSVGTFTDIIRLLWGLWLGKTLTQINNLIGIKPSPMTSYRIVSRFDDRKQQDKDLFWIVYEQFDQAGINRTVKQIKKC